MIEFPCCFKKHIYRKYEEEGIKEFGCDAIIKFSLTFAPYPKLQIFKNGAAMNIVHVTYNYDKGDFLCMCEPSYLNATDGCGYEGLKQIAIEDGWSLSELKEGIYED